MLHSFTEVTQLIGEKGAEWRVVWDALTNPDVLKLGFAPQGMSNSFISTELKKDGLFRFCFKQDGSDAEFWGRGRYVKIDAPNYLSY